MTRRRWILISVGLVVIVAGAVVLVMRAGGDGEPDGVRVRSVADLADRLACSSLESEADPGPVAQVAESGTCVRGGSDLILSYFDSAGHRAEWLRQIEQLAGSPGIDVHLLVGANWAVQARSGAELQPVRAVVGGDLVP